MDTNTLTRCEVKVNGIVQGVGFRPFIYRLAHNFNLTGFVSNTNDGVIIEVQGEDNSVRDFIMAINNESPPLSSISTLSTKTLELNSLDEKFLIIKSSETLGNKTLISPDVAICNDCISDISDKNNRRFHYAFTNCTNCGPRFTIIEKIPYDRKYTTMEKFEMCPECKSEFEDPINRRFHAQPNACPVCGPKVWLANNKNETEKGENPLEHAANLLLKGKILAIKGLGGFHLACDANNNSVVNELRKRKNREAKPLAVMCRDFESVRSIAKLNDSEMEILESPEHPIVLLEKSDSYNLSDSISPDNGRIGVMLPYTPLHCVLFEHLKKFSKVESPILVMTSANISDEPIAIKNDEAFHRLADIADYFVFHDREILIRSDDSIVLHDEDTFTYRRSRGFVPKHIPLSGKFPSILAVGAELKNSICLSKDDKAFPSQYIGDLTNLPAINFFEETTKHMQQILDTNFEFIARDYHPNYLSSQWADKQTNKSIFKIQHHHAHMASCMLENKIDEDVIGVICDGTGLGYDNAIWGGEIFIGSYTKFERFAHNEYIQLPGGDAASKECWRSAVSYLYKSFDGEIPLLPHFQDLPVDQIQMILEKNLNSPLTSSTGRLFDAVAAIAGGPKINRFEAEAAIHFMHSVNDFNAKAYEIKGDSDFPELEFKDIIKSVYFDFLEGESYSTIASRFHRSLSLRLRDAVIRAYNYSGINKVVLSGGVFQNTVLLKMLVNDLQNEKFNVFTQKKIPCNDGGISLGQVAIVTKLLAENLSEPIYNN
ncbi:MAG: carbamoyltransferase HypF [Melioribacteraceae bacterium]|nr:carbamoyltransferase HypF [Melioribacteraceae bacterium]